MGQSCRISRIGARSSTARMRPSPGLVLLHSCWEIPVHRALHVRGCHTALASRHHTASNTQPAILTALSLSLCSHCILAACLQLALPAAAAYVCPSHPDTLESVCCCTAVRKGREPESQQMRELMTRLAISRRSEGRCSKLDGSAQEGRGVQLAAHTRHRPAEARHVVARVARGRGGRAAGGQQHEEESDEGANGGEEVKEDTEEEKVSDEDSRPLPGQSHDYTGPDFATFALSCPLPRFVHLLLSVAASARGAAALPLRRPSGLRSRLSPTTVRGVEARRCQDTATGQRQLGTSVLLLWIPRLAHIPRGQCEAHQTSRAQGGQSEKGARGGVTTRSRGSRRRETIKTS